MAKSNSKSKLNRKFLMLVGGFLVFATLVIGGILYWSFNGAPERNVKLGDELVAAAKVADAAGNADEAYKKYKEAVSRYGRALNKKQNNLEYSSKMLDAIALMTPKTSTDAQELYQTSIQLLQKRTRSAPLDSSQWMRLIDVALEQAEFYDESAAWRSVTETCNEAIDKISPTDPMRSVIEGIQITSLLRQDDVLTLTERAAAQSQANEFLKAHPQDEKVWAALLTAMGANLDRLLISNQAADAKEQQQNFDRTLAASKLAVPNSVKVALAQIEELIILLRRRDPNVTVKGMSEILNPILWMNGDRNSTQFGSITNGSSRDITRAALLSASMADKDAAARAVQVLEQYCVKNPTAVAELMMLARLQQSAAQSDAARATCDKILSLPQPKVSMLASSFDGLRLAALEEIFTIDFAKFSAATDAAEKPALLARVKVARENIVKVADARDGEQAVARADARLAFAENDFLTAITKFDEIFAKQKNVAPEYYLMAALSLRERGEQGAALTMVNSGIDEYPSDLRFYSVRASLQAALGRNLDAQRTVQFILERDPNNADALRAMADLKARPEQGGVTMVDSVNKILGEAEVLATTGRVDDAIQKCQAALVQSPKDARLQRMIVQWQLFAGRPQDAEVSLKQFLLDNPTDTVLKQYAIVVRVKSPIERIVLLVNQPGPDGKVASTERRAVALAVALGELRDETKQRLQSSPEADKAQLTTQLTEVTAATQDAVAKAIAAAPGDAQLIDRLFNDAMIAKDYARGDQLIALADKNCPDRTIPILIRGRMALERGDFAGAVGLMEQAVVLPGASSQAFRLLGVAKERAGDIDGAREAYAKSYDRRPDDVVTVELYSAILARTGKINEARQVMRAALQAMPQSVPIRNVYLNLEAMYGDKGSTILERRRMYSLRPGDIENARQLMVLLAQTPMTPQLMMNEDGTPKFSPESWGLLDPTRQAELIDASAAESLKQAAVIYEGLLKMNSSDLTTVRTFSAALQRGGHGREAEATMRSFIDRADATVSWQAWTALGEQQLEGGREDDAATSFAKAIDLDTSAKSVASLIIAKIWAERQNSARSLAVLTAAFAKTPTLEIGRSLTAAKLEMRDLKGAEAMAVEVAKLAGSNLMFTDYIVGADVANAEIEAAMDAENIPAKAAAIAEFAKQLDAAIRLEPANPLPFIIRGASLQRRYQRTGEADLLRQAKLDATHAVELKPDYWPATKFLAAIYLDENNIAGSIQLLRQYIEQNPTSVEPRQALVGYMLSSGDSFNAVKTAEAMVQDQPRNPKWLSSLADAYAANDQPLQAADVCNRLYEVSGSPEWIAQSVMRRAKSTPPDCEGLLATIRSVPPAIAATPFLQMIGAGALAATGQTEIQKNQGKLQLRDFRKAVDADANGNLADPWVVAASLIFLPEKPQEFEKFFLESWDNKPTSSMYRAVAQALMEVGPQSYPKALEFARLASTTAQTEMERYIASLILGTVLYKTGAMVEAAAAFEAALVLRPDDFSAINNLAFLEASALDKVPQAIARGRAAFVKNPQNTDLMDTLGYALTKAGQYQEAIGLLRRSSRIKPSAIVFAHLAQAQIAAGQRSEALLTLERAKSLKPDAETQKEIDDTVKLLETNPRG